MIKAKIENGTVSCSACGSVVEISADISVLIGSIHANYIKAGETEVAELFMRMVGLALTRPDSPVWGCLDGAEGVTMCIPLDAAARQGD